MKLEIPEVLRREHRQLDLQLQSATVLSTPLGLAARNLATILHSHLLREEQFALPLLGVLPHLADGKVGTEMGIVVPIAERLRRELPSLRQEHVAIVDALEAFAEAARAEDRAEYVQLAHALIEHVRTEEAILYPAALMAGEYVRLYQSRENLVH
jgi:iron-sulfur cluster repair protein YtfE (RIC family)